jgi:hypothetical protein
MKKRKKPPEPLNETFSREPYDGRELRVNEGIPESRFEAFKLPSIVNGKRYYPKPRT